MTAVGRLSLILGVMQGRPLGGVSGALAPGADFEGAPKRRSPTGHTYCIALGIALLIFNLGARRELVVSTKPRPLYPRERPGTHFTGGCILYSALGKSLCTYKRC
jgi:hypothetical protein